MYYLKTLLSVMVILLPYLKVWTQPTNKNNSLPLNIGASVPDITFKDPINSVKKIINLSDFKGKLVILDFYATWCSGCQAGILKLDSLQKKFPDKLQVIVICHDQNSDIVNKAIAKRWPGISLSFPFIIDNNPKSLLNSSFRHKLLPHEVWISPEGKYLAATTAHEISLGNILKAFNNSGFAAKQKIDILDFNIEKQPITELKPSILNACISGYSILTRNIPGLSGCRGYEADTLRKIQRIYFTNVDLGKILSSIGFSRKKLIFNGVDPNKIISTIGLYFDKSDTYCYEITAPLSLSWPQIRNTIFQDLNLYSPFRMDTIYEMTNCWVLKKTDRFDSSIISSIGHFQQKIYVDKNGEKICKLNNIPTSSLLNYLDYNNNTTTSTITTPIVLDETGIQEKLTLSFKEKDFRIFQFEDFNQDLNKYGLELIKTTRKILKLRISNKN